MEDGSRERADELRSNSEHTLPAQHRTQNGPLRERHAADGGGEAVDPSRPRPVGIWHPRLARTSLGVAAKSGLTGMRPTEL